MTAHHLYELRLGGSSPERAVAALAANPTAGAAGRPVTVVGRETVLVTGRIGQQELSDLLVRISDLGLDIQGFRRVPGRPPRS